MRAYGASLPWKADEALSERSSKPWGGRFETPDAGRAVEVRLTPILKCHGRTDRHLPSHSPEGHEGRSEKGSVFSPAETLDRKPYRPPDGQKPDIGQLDEGIWDWLNSCRRARPLSAAPLLSKALQPTEVIDQLLHHRA